MVLNRSYEPTLRAVTEDPAPAALCALPGVAVWAPDGSGTVELARLAGPRRGMVMAPRHLLGAGEHRRFWDVDDAAVKIRLYELCLSAGGPFDIYRYVNLGELLRLWARLRLPATVRETWERAFVQAGLAASVARSGRRPGVLAG